MSVAASNRSRFTLIYGVVMLAILLVGFGPSFFFRTLSSRPDLPAYLIVHGLAGTAWFVLFAAQVLLASLGKVQWHRQLGVVGVGIAIVFVVTGVQSTLAFTHKLATQGDFVATNGSGETFVYFALGVSYGGLAMFACTLGAALYFRRRPDVHGRLMLLATSGLLGPAIARVVTWFTVLPSPLMAVTLLFMVAMLVYDLRTRGRPHIATVLGGILSNAIITVSIVAFMVLGLGPWVMQHAAR